MYKVLSVFLLSAMLASLALVVDLDFSSAQAPIQVKGILTQDTLWSKQGSPYVFGGAVGVAEGVTLTIAAGVTVDIGSYYLEVNGTLNVEGTATDQVFFVSDENPANGPFIGWTEAYPVASGHNNIVVAYGDPIINLQNAVLTDTSLFGQGMYSNATVTISECSLLDSSVNVWGTTSITNSYATGAIRVKGIVTLTDSTFTAGVELRSDAFVVSRNNITNKGDAAVMVWGTGTIAENVIWGSNYGITQDDSTTLSATIERNLIKNNTYGICLRDESNDAVIKDNTFTENKVGIYNPTYQLTITGNSFINNQQYDIRAGSAAVSARDNWWGTTDRTAIAAKIYDSNDDFSLGTVVYLPVLTNANANTPDPNMCSVQQVQSTPTPTELNSVSYQTGGQTTLTTFNGIEIGVITSVAVVGILVTFIVLRARRKSQLLI